MKPADYGGLCDRNVNYRGDLVRNIKGIRDSQHLFDDLSADPADWYVAIAAEGEARIPTDAAIIARAFDYGTAITYSFATAHWQASRFSNGTRYGVWYGAEKLATTVYETVHHWFSFLCASFPALDRTIIGERRVFDVRCDGLLIDLRGKEREFPGLVNRASYGFTHDLGAYIADQGQNGLLVASARCSGVNAAVFNPLRLSNARHKTFLTYRCNPREDHCVVERTPGRRWMEIRPTTLA